MFKRILTKSLFQEHMAKHSGDKPYKCEVCPKQFNHKTDLRRHMCLHTGEKPFTCDVCGKGFIREDRMVKHADTNQVYTIKTMTDNVVELEDAQSAMVDNYIV